MPARALDNECGRVFWIVESTQTTSFLDSMASDLPNHSLRSAFLSVLGLWLRFSPSSFAEKSTHSEKNVALRTRSFSM